MAKDCLGYRSVWELFESEFMTGQPREQTISKLVSAGYSKRQATKTYASYRRRLTLLHEHAEGKHRLFAKCTHWVSPYARALAGDKVVAQTTKPADNARDWVVAV